MAARTRAEFLNIIMWGEVVNTQIIEHVRKQSRIRKSPDATTKKYHFSGSTANWKI